MMAMTVMVVMAVMAVMKLKAVTRLRLRVLLLPMPMVLLPGSRLALVEASLLLCLLLLRTSKLLKVEVDSSAWFLCEERLYMLFEIPIV